MSAYYSYRIFLIETSPSQLELHTERVKKEQRFRFVFDLLETEHKIHFNDYGTECILTHFKKINTDISIWQLGKKQVYTKPVEGSEIIETIDDIRFPFIFLIFHKKKQIVFIQLNTSVFQELDSVKNRLERFLSNQMSGGFIDVKLSEISDNKEFWTKIEDLDAVTEVEFDYNPPNFFGAEKQFDKLVNNVHKESSFDKFKIILQNKYRGLKFQAQTFGETISRLSSGAGSYVVKGFKNGIEQTIKSFTVPFRKNIDDIENYPEEKIESDFEEADKLNDNGKQK